VTPEQRADLHVHSRYSDRSSHPVVRALGSAESFTEPLDIYRLARARGMDFVTITDHDTLAGSLAIAHLPGTFLSVELSTRLPEAGLPLHVVALDIPERLFPAARAAARASVHDLVACLREAGVAHFLAHPFLDPRRRLTPDALERLLLLFNVFEGRNGARTALANGLLQQVVAALTPERLAAMAERQGIAPWGEEPWRKALVGGSDDHSGLFVAGAWTAAGGDGTATGFVRAVAAGRCRPGGDDGSALTLAHNIYASAFWRLRELLRLDEPPARRRLHGPLRRTFGRVGRDVPVLEKTVHGVRRLAPGLYRGGDGPGPAWEALLARDVAPLAAPGGLAAVGTAELDRRLFRVAATLADAVVRHHLTTLLDRRQAPRRRALAGFAVALVHLLELPYFYAWRHHAAERRRLGPLRARLWPGAGPHDGRAAVVGGDAAALAVAPEPLRLLVGAEGEGGDGDGLVAVPALALRPSPDGGSPRPVLPSLLLLLDHLDRAGATALRSADRGALRLAARLAGRLLRLRLL